MSFGDRWSGRRALLKLATLALPGGLSACAGAARKEPRVVLERDFFGSHRPDEDTTYAQVFGPAPVLTDLRFVYLIDHWPSGYSDERANSRRTALNAALQKIGLPRVLGPQDIRAMLLARGAVFKFERNANLAELNTLADELGPFAVLETEYAYGLRFLLAARDPRSGKLLMTAQYRTRVWNDIDNELILPALNVYANWLHGSMRLLAAP
jgi:hypothetical protein